jgi:hypothetical protein
MKCGFLFMIEYHNNLSLEPLFYINEEGLVCKEEFRDVPCYEGMYQVSDLGRVKSVLRKSWNGHSFIVQKEKILKSINNKGYLYVAVCKKSKSYKKQIHQLVAMSFLNHVPCGYEIVVDHINNIRIDNRLVNLQITTNRENCSKDKIGKGSSKYTGVYWHKTSQKWRAMIRINGKRKYLGLFANELEAYESYKKQLDEIKKALLI